MGLVTFALKEKDAKKSEAGWGCHSWAGETDCGYCKFAAYETLLLAIDMMKFLM